jgi:hypothetical protein
VFGKDVNKEKSSEFRRVDMLVAGNEDDLFGRPVDNYEDGVVFTGDRKLLDEVDRNRMPRTEGNRKRL